MEALGVIALYVLVGMGIVRLYRAIYKRLPANWQLLLADVQQWIDQSVGLSNEEAVQPVARPTQRRHPRIDIFDEEE